jgi:hypothetical protein
VDCAAWHRKAAHDRALSGLTWRSRHFSGASKGSKETGVRAVQVLQAAPVWKRHARGSRGSGGPPPTIRDADRWFLFLLSSVGRLESCGSLAAGLDSGLSGVGLALRGKRSRGARARRHSPSATAKSPTGARTISHQQTAQNTDWSFKKVLSNRQHDRLRQEDGREARQHQLAVSDRAIPRVRMPAAQARFT